jgi:hypothetical protein
MELNSDDANGLGSWLGGRDSKPEQSLISNMVMARDFWH